METTTYITPIANTSLRGSIEKAEVFKALAKFKENEIQIYKNCTVKVETRSGGSYTFKYADLSGILEVVNPLLAKEGLSISQDLRKRNLYTWIFHSSGQYLEYKLYIPKDFYFVKDKDTGKDQHISIQDFGGVITYLKRYHVVEVLGISAEDDTDGNTPSNDGVLQNFSKTSDKWFNEPEKKQFIEMVNKGATTEELKSFVSQYKVNNKAKAEIADILAKKDKPTAHAFNTAKPTAPPLPTAPAYKPKNPAVAPMANMIEAALDNYIDEALEDISNISNILTTPNITAEKIIELAKKATKVEEIDKLIQLYGHMPAMPRALQGFKDQLIKKHDSTLM